MSGRCRRRIRRRRRQKKDRSDLTPFLRRRCVLVLISFSDSMMPRPRRGAEGGAGTVLLLLLLGLSAVLLSAPRLAGGKLQEGETNGCCSPAPFPNHIKWAFPQDPPFIKAADAVVAASGNESRFGRGRRIWKKGEKGEKANKVTRERRGPFFLPSNAMLGSSLSYQLLRPF